MPSTRVSFLLLTFCSFAVAANGPLLLRHPALGKTKIVFTYAGDLWSVGRDGGEAVRLTTGRGQEGDPVFSSDGSTVAFSGEYDGNIDVYTVSADGGVPKRITYHPAPEAPVAFSPDGKKILFRSTAESYSRFPKLFSVSVDGGLPESLPLPAGFSGSYSADGARLAYMPIAPAFEIWKRYRGGRTTPIWIASMADSKVQKIPRENSNDINPLWIGKEVYFLSDRSGAVTLFSYDPASGKTRERLPSRGLDVKYASAFANTIAYEQFGTIYLFDAGSGKSRKVDVHVSADVLDVRPEFTKVEARIAQGRISPTGARAVFEARGDVFTVPAQKGDVRNLTASSGSADRDPSWSPDGKQIAYFSDRTGEYKLYLAGQEGLSPASEIALGDKPAYFYEPSWSPDSKKIAYTDNRLNVWNMDLERKTPVKIDTDTFQTPFRDLNPAWSPDSKWIAYNKILKNHLRAVFLYSLESGKSTQITDGLSDANHAQWDRDGKYVYFTASTDRGLSTAWLDMSSLGRRTTSSPYVVVLNKNDPSPLAPESDEEKGAPAKPEDKKPDGATKAPPTVHVDLDGIDQRILALPMPPRTYVGLATGKAGLLYLPEITEGEDPFRDRPTITLHKFDLKARKAEKLAERINGFDISFDGEKMLFKQNGKWAIASATAVPKPGEGILKTDAMEARVDPRAEWQQMYNEVWRIERDFFYDPSSHGLNLTATADKYRPYLDSISNRDDLNYLFDEMLGELSVGHLFVRGGAMPDVKKIPGGLLGADYKIENGRYRISRVYYGENWNPDLKAPLTAPGVNVAAGDYLLTVNGRELRDSDNLYSFFESTAGKSVVLRVASGPFGNNARQVTVVPIADEGNLRNRAWMDENRKLVDKMSNGRLAYVYLPNTAGAGYTNFNRYYFAQVGKEGAVIDERFNGGGDIADYIIDYLKRPLTNFFTTRYGQDFTTPQNQIFGPKAMVINEYAGSGGDAMPWLFRQRQVGKLVGKRTWGGLVGIFGFPELIDGGSITAPNLAFYNLTAEWDVENHGVPPDVDVDLDPALVRAGHDPQLEKAVDVLLEQLKQHPLPKYRKPPYPNYHRQQQPALAAAQPE